MLTSTTHPHLYFHVVLSLRRQQQMNIDNYFIKNHINNNNKNRRIWYFCILLYSLISIFVHTSIAASTQILPSHRSTPDLLKPTNVSIPSNELTAKPKYSTTLISQKPKSKKNTQVSTISANNFKQCSSVFSKLHSSTSKHNHPSETSSDDKTAIMLREKNDIVAQDNRPIAKALTEIKLSRGSCPATLK